MKYIDYVVRFLVGGLFIFSGLVKLNDPMGTQIKLEEYFEVFSTDFAHFFEWFIPMAMPLGLFLVILEVILGIAVLLNFKMRWTTVILSLLILFFTFLTFYSAYFNKVTDCGCFGDAIPLTPWESFFKDLILVVLIAYLLAKRDGFKALLSTKLNSIILTGSTVICIFLGVYAIRHLPFIDFRPYSVGDNLPANMIAPEQPNFVYTFEKDGKEVKSATYLSAEEGYVYVSNEITNAENTIPKITDYNIYNEEVGDYTAQSFVGLKLFIIVYDAKTAGREKLSELSTLIKELGPEAEAITLTSSSGQAILDLWNEYQIDIPYFYADATVLKAMIRSSPGIMLLQDGTVLGKWHYNDTPSAAEVRSLF